MSTITITDASDLREGDIATLRFVDCTTTVTGILWERRIGSHDVWTIDGVTGSWPRPLPQRLFVSAERDDTLPNTPGAYLDEGGLVWVLDAAHKWASITSTGQKKPTGPLSPLVPATEVLAERKRIARYAHWLADGWRAGSPAQGALRELAADIEHGDIEEADA